MSGKHLNPSLTKKTPDRRPALTLQKRRDTYSEIVSGKPNYDDEAHDQRPHLVGSSRRGALSLHIGTAVRLFMSDSQQRLG